MCERMIYTSLVGIESQAGRKTNLRRLVRLDCRGKHVLAGIETRDGRLAEIKRQSDRDVFQAFFRA